MILTALIFLLLLTVLVVIHEAGHYFAAKKFGIKVEEFGFGIPPRAWGVKKGETIWSINWLPLGGFVKLYGEDEAGSGSVKTSKAKLPTKDLDRAFFSRPVWQRAIVVVAGVVMNALLAIVIYYAYLSLAGYKAELPLLTDYKFALARQENKSEIIINEVAKGSPAEKAGIAEISKVISINGQQLKSGDALSKIIQANKGKEITLVWQNVQTNETKTTKLIPRVNPPKGQGALGIAFFPVKTAVLHYETPVQKVLSGIVHPFNLMGYNFDVIKSLVAVSFKEKTAAPISEGVSGPVGIFSLVGTIVDIPDMKEKVLQILNLAGLLSISLAFFNVLPIPALDGGRLFFIVIEGLTGKKVSPELEAKIHSIGMAVLLGLILLITFKDIANLF